MPDEPEADLQYEEIWGVERPAPVPVRRGKARARVRPSAEVDGTRSAIKAHHERSGSAFLGVAEAVRRAIARQDATHRVVQAQGRRIDWIESILASREGAERAD